MSGRLRIRTWSGITVLCALALAVPATRASDTAVDADGGVHRIEVVSAQSEDSIAGTALRYTFEPVDGAVIVETVPGTGDAEPDKQPDLALDPVSGAPVVVWSRIAGDGSTVLLRRRDADGWSDAVRIAGPDPSELLAPTVSARRNLIHVVWGRNAVVPPERIRLSLDRRDLDVAYGPEWLPLGADNLVPPSGGPGTDDGDARDLSYFASTLPPDATSPGSGGTLVVWGIRDEPIPITFREGFRLPGEVRSSRVAAAGWVHDRLVVWVRSGDRVHYVLRDDDGGWTEFRAVPLEADQGTGDAVRMIEAMLRRQAEGSQPD